MSEQIEGQYVTANATIAKGVVMSLTMATQGPAEAFATLVLSIMFLHELNAANNSSPMPSPEEICKEFSIAYHSIKASGDVAKH